MSFDEFNIQNQGKATPIGLCNAKLPGMAQVADVESSLDELSRLLETLGLEPTAPLFQKRAELDPATMLGKGKLLEFAEIAKAEGSDLLVFDFELNAGQSRNIKKLTGLDVLDRCMVILEIFARHARTKEAKTQVEIARLGYMLPRLQSLWSHFSKQKGGIGLKGEGEQQLELDRRIIRARIEFYKDQLATLSKSRIEKSKRRQNKAVSAALVGYTNAGKSSLMNKLCQVNLLAENKLFATLDSTYRMLNPDTHPPMILVDTVGFIQNLPNTLVEGFKTTLESAIEADLLIIVVDISDPAYKKHLQVTQEVLADLGVRDKEQIIVFNKSDALKDPFLPKLAMRNLKASFLVSTHNDEDVTKLREFIIETFLERQNIFDLFIPYSDGQAQAKVLKNANILATNHHEQGTYYKIRLPQFIFDSLALHPFLMKE